MATRAIVAATKVKGAAMEEEKAEGVIAMVVTVDTVVTTALIKEMQIGSFEGETSPGGGKVTSSFLPRSSRHLSKDNFQCNSS